MFIKPILSTKFTKILGNAHIFPDRYGKRKGESIPRMVHGRVRKKGVEDWWRRYRTEIKVGDEGSPSSDLEELVLLLKRDRKGFSSKTDAHAFIRITTRIRERIVRFMDLSACFPLRLGRRFPYGHTDAQTDKFVCPSRRSCNSPRTKTIILRLFTYCQKFDRLTQNS